MLFIRLIIPIVYGGLLLLCGGCSNSHSTTTSWLDHAEQLIETHPDSALHWLQNKINNTTMPQEESARYALLWAQACDKCQQSLLPCDSILDVARIFYNKKCVSQAVALLYKGRIEIEIKQNAKAIGYFLQGIEILQNHPQEITVKRELYRSLSSEYYHARLYAKAQNSYWGFYQCATCNQDKSLALNGLSDCFYKTNRLDSALHYQQLSMYYAQLAGDSTTLATAANGLSIRYLGLHRTDTALHYARMAFRWLPQQADKGCYYNTMSDVFYQLEQIDSAQYYLNLSLQNITDIDLQHTTEDLKRLSYIKWKQHDYQSTATLLYQLIGLTDSAFFAEQSTEVEQLIHRHDLKRKLHRQHAHERVILHWTIAGFLVLFFLIIVCFQQRIHRRNKQRLLHEQQLKQAQERLVNLKHTIDESQRIIGLLAQQQTNLTQQRTTFQTEIAEREIVIKQLKQEKEALRNWLFKQSNIYKKIIKLDKQVVSSPKELTVLTHAEQKLLKETINDIYADCIADWQTHYPMLTNEDLLYLCLEQTGLSNKLIAFCFGNTNTHALAQRKYRLKERMNRH